MSNFFVILSITIHLLFISSYSCLANELFEKKVNVGLGKNESITVPFNVQVSASSLAITVHENAGIVESTYVDISINGQSYFVGTAPGAISTLTSDTLLTLSSQKCETFTIDSITLTDTGLNSYSGTWPGADIAGVNILVKDNHCHPLNFGNQDQCN